MSSVTGFLEGMFSHNRIMLSIVGALIMIGSATAFFLNRSDHQNQNARNALYLAEKKLEADTKSAGTKKVDVDTHFAESLAQLKKVENDFPRTRPAYEARLRLGNLYFNHSHYEKALPWFEKATQTAPTKLEKALALSAVGYSYENLKKGNAAIQTFQKAIDLGETSIKGELLMAIARCYEAVQDPTKARSTYDQVLSELPNTEYAKSAEVYKSQL